MSYFKLLPTEIILKIFAMSDDYSNLSLFHTCKYFLNFKYNNLRSIQQDISKLISNIDNIKLTSMLRSKIRFFLKNEDKHPATNILLYGKMNITYIYIVEHLTTSLDFFEKFTVKEIKKHIHVSKTRISCNNRELYRILNIKYILAKCGKINISDYDMLLLSVVLHRKDDIIKYKDMKITKGFKLYFLIFYYTMNNHNDNDLELFVIWFIIKHMVNFRSNVDEFINLLLYSYLDRLYVIGYLIGILPDFKIDISHKYIEYYNEITKEIYKYKRNHTGVVKLLEKKMNECGIIYNNDKLL